MHGEDEHHAGKKRKRCVDLVQRATPTKKPKTATKKPRRSVVVVSSDSEVWSI